MRIKTIVFLLAAVFVFINRANCSELIQARLAFRRGNSYYSGEKFEKAITDYEKAIALGFVSGPLYYNLANAYFKQGALGKAILNYSRAQRLIPDDPDLKSNLAYAQSFVENQGVAPKRNWFRRLFLGLERKVNLNQVTLVTMVLYFVSSVLVIAAILIKKSRKTFIYISAGALVLLIVCAILFSRQLYKTVIQTEAVVITQTSDCKFEPFDKATTFFTLYEGEKVVVRVVKKDWVKLQRFDGKQGWVKKIDVEFL